MVGHFKVASYNLKMFVFLIFPVECGSMDFNRITT